MAVQALSYRVGWETSGGGGVCVEIQERRRSKNEKMWADVELSKDCINFQQYRKILSAQGMSSSPLKRAK